MRSEELNADAPKSIFSGFAASAHRVTVVALLGKSMRTPTRRQRQCHANHRAVVKAFAHASANAHAPHVCGLGDLFPLPTGAIVSNHQRGNSQLEPLAAAPVGGGF